MTIDSQGCASGIHEWACMSVRPAASAAMGHTSGTALPRRPQDEAGDEKPAAPRASEPQIIGQATSVRVRTGNTNIVFQ